MVRPLGWSNGQQVWSLVFSQGNLKADPLLSSWCSWCKGASILDQQHHGFPHARGQDFCLRILRQEGTLLKPWPRRTSPIALTKSSRTTATCAMRSSRRSCVNVVIVTVSSSSLSVVIVLLFLCGVFGVSCRSCAALSVSAWLPLHPGEVPGSLWRVVQCVGFSNFDWQSSHDLNEEVMYESMYKNRGVDSFSDSRKQRPPRRKSNILHQLHSVFLSGCSLWCFRYCYEEKTAIREARYFSLAVFCHPSQAVRVTGAERVSFLNRLELSVVQDENGKIRNESVPHMSATQVAFGICHSRW